MSNEHVHPIFRPILEGIASTKKDEPNHASLTVLCQHCGRNPAEITKILHGGLLMSLCAPCTRAYQADEERS